MRSNISTLASTAIPVDITKPAMPGRVSVKPGISLKIAQNDGCVDSQRYRRYQTRDPVINNHEKGHADNAD